MLVNLESFWGQSKWGEAEWTQYSATWGNGKWGICLWGISLLGLLRELLRQMEKENIGTYCFEAGCVEPGVDNADTPLRRALDNLEK